MERWLVPMSGSKSDTLGSNDGDEDIVGAAPEFNTIRG